MGRLELQGEIIDVATRPVARGIDRVELRAGALDQERAQVATGQRQPVEAKATQEAVAHHLDTALGIRGDQERGRPLDRATQRGDGLGLQPQAWPIWLSTGG